MAPAGKDVLQQPLEQSIASLDAEWGTKVNDEDDWAEKAAQEKRRNMLKKKEVCRRGGLAAMSEYGLIVVLIHANMLLSSNLFPKPFRSE
jgi:hypothetical protein